MGVYDASGKLLQSVDANDTPGDDLTLHLAGGHGGSDYYLKVEKSADDVFAVGGYRLTLTPDGSTGGSGGPTKPPPSPGGSAPVVNLQAKVYRSDGRFSYADQADLAGGAAVARFRFHTPPQGGDLITVTAWSTDGAFQPEVTLSDNGGTPVAARVLVAENGSYVLQLPQGASDGQYLVSVADADPSGPGGAFFLGINFGGTPVALDTFTGGNSFTRPDAYATGTLHVTASQLFHFVATAGPGPAGEGVAVGVRDASWAEVASVLAPAGGAATATVFLPAGDYAFRLTPVAGAVAFAPLAYRLEGLGVSNPIGPTPASVSATPQGDTGGPGGVGYWWQGGFLAFLTLTNPPPVTPRPGPGSGTGTGAGSSGGVVTAPPPPCAGDAPPASAAGPATSASVGGAGSAAVVRNALFALGGASQTVAGTPSASGGPAGGLGIVPTGSTARVGSLVAAGSPVGPAETAAPAAPAYVFLSGGAVAASGARRSAGACPGRDGHPSGEPARRRAGAARCQPRVARHAARAGRERRAVGRRRGAAR